MSATNRTTNYNLPIFIETDKPAWLVDFNGAMRSIDTQMKTNADAIATKSPILTFNDTADIDFTKSGDIITANLSSGVAGTVSRALVKPVSAPSETQLASVDSSNNQEMLNLGEGLIVDNGTLKAIDLNLTATQISLNQIVVETSGFTLATNTGSMAIAKNSDGSIAKIYGRVRIASTLSSNTAVYLRLPVTVGATGLNEDIVINPSGFSIRSTPGSSATAALEFANVIRISPDGTIKLVGTIPANSTTDMYYFPSLYFIKNFGDIE